MVGDGHITSGQKVESEQEVELGSETFRPVPSDPLPPIVLDIVKEQFFQRASPAGDRVSNT